MAKAKFKIRPGVYIVPNLGRIDATAKLKQETELALYLNKDFPFIELLEGGVNFLKKQKLSQKTISGLIMKSQSAEEIELLSKLSDSETIARIVKQRLESLE
jgi:hypothetical protein